MGPNTNAQGVSSNDVARNIEHELIENAIRRELIERKVIPDANIETELIGKATRQELIEREVIFDAPNKDVVLKVVSIQNDVQIKDINVASGTVLVSGYLNSCIMYTTMKRPQGENNQNKNNNGYVNMQSNNSSGNNKNKNKEQPKPSCGLVDNSVALDGVVRHTTVLIPFKSFISAAEVQEGDICSVTSSAALDNVKSLAVDLIYEDQYEDVNNQESTTSIMRGDEEQKFIKGIVNKTLVELNIDIKRPVQKK